MRYNTILMDADGTLFDFLRCEREAVGEALREMGVSPTEQMLDDYSEINDGLWKKLEKGEILRSVLIYRRFELLFERYGVRADPHAMARAYMMHLSEKGYLLDGAEELCRRLHGRVRLYIVTNGTDFIQRERFARSGILPYFDDVFISDGMGCEKPSRAYFEAVEKGIPDFDRARTLVVGDSLSSDIRGGIGYGLDTCWYNPLKKVAPEDIRERITFTADSLEAVYHFIMQGEGV